jgi:phosphomannomutase
MTPTPLVMYAVEKDRGIQGGISVTASHNGAEWNGMKFIAASGLFLDKEENEKLWSYVDGPMYDGAVKKGSIELRTDIEEQFLKELLALPILNTDAIRSRQYRIAVDAVNASGSFIVRKLLERLNVTVIPVAIDGSGIFPHQPEPIPAHLTELCRVVVEHSADLGIAVDPDADRCVIITDSGEPMVEENTIVLAAEEVLSASERGQSVVVNLSTTRAVEDVAQVYDATVYRTPVGEINVAKKMREVRAVIGGEGSGGVIYPSMHTGRDSLAAIVLILSNLVRSKKTASEKKRSLPRYEIVKEKIDIAGRSLHTIFDALLRYYTDIAIDINDEDGLRFDFGSSWLHIRASNTEPIIRMIAEAPTREEAVQLLENTRSAIV